MRTGLCRKWGREKTAEHIGWRKSRLQKCLGALSCYGVGKIIPRASRRLESSSLPWNACSWLMAVEGMSCKVLLCREFFLILNQGLLAMIHEKVVVNTSWETSGRVLVAPVGNIKRVCCYFPRKWGRNGGEDNMVQSAMERSKRGIKTFLYKALWE